MDLANFVELYPGKDFIHAKINQYRGMTYNTETYRFEGRPYYFMREWGDLSHPPLYDIEDQDIALINAQFSGARASDELVEASPYTKPAFHKEMDEKSKSELTVGNELELVMDDSSYNKKMELIRKAKESIYVSSLVFVSEQSVIDLVDLLIEKKKEGLDVRVVAEKSIAIYHWKELRRLKRAGVGVVKANDFFQYNTSVVYHTKIVLIDGKEVVIGGQNMLDADLASKGIDFKNRDADMWAKGPMVLDVLLNFMRDWNHFVSKGFSLTGNHKNELFDGFEFNLIEDAQNAQRESGLRGAGNYDGWFQNYSARPQGMARFIGQSPYRDIDTITEAHLMYINGLQSYFALTTPHIFGTHTPDKEGLVFTQRYRNFNRLFNSIQNKLSGLSGFEMDLLTTGAGFAVNEATPMFEARMQRLVENGHPALANLNLRILNSTNRRLYRKMTYDYIVGDWASHDNARVWTHMSYLHSKIWLFDRVAVSIGSLNLHNNATDHSYEATVIVHDEDFIRETEKQLALDLANSIPMFAE